MTRGTFSSSAFGGGGVCVGGRRRAGVGVAEGKGVVVAVEGRVVVVVVAAVEGRRCAVGGGRWLGWEAVGSRADSGDKAVLAVAANHGHMSALHTRRLRVE